MATAQGPSQGLNLGGQPSAYGDTFSALNLFHGADAWIMQGPNGEEIRDAVTVDVQGWLTELPVVDGQPQTVWVNVFYSNIVPAGSYIVEWQGEGTLLPWQDFEVIGPNKYRINYNPNYANGQDGITLRIEATDPNHTGNYIRDIKIYEEKYSDLVAMGENFNPEWFQAVDDFRVLRTHDWQGTNFSTVTDWVPANQTANQAFWVDEGRGMPFELLVDMANQTRSDLWINIPHMATDDYMRQAALYVKENLSPDLRVNVEYSNEYWTEGFDQHQYLIDKGVEMFGDAEFSLAEAYGARASQLTLIFKEVFAGDQARLFPTVTLNHGAFNTAEALAMLTTPHYVAQGGISPLDAGIKNLSTDGYFSWYSDNANADPLLDPWIAQGNKSFGAARDFLIDQIKTDLAPAWAKGRALSDQYGLQFGVYEGGALLIDASNEPNGTPKYYTYNQLVQLSPEMKQVYEVALAEWQKVGSGPFAWYSDTGRPGPGGDYGLWNAPDFKPELRTQAIINANATVPAWWNNDSRPASTFANSTYDAGTAGRDSLSGSNLTDRLYGLDGNDTIIGLGGNDILVGGKGVDKIDGGTGDDTLIGGAGADKLVGGVGFDIATYKLSTESITADLASKGTKGDATGDTFKTIEGLAGGSASDNLFGDTKANRLFGDKGNDTLNGRAGDDRLNGGEGNDILTGGTGNDIFYLSSGNDVVTDWTEGDHVVVAGAGWAYADPSQVQISQSGNDTLLTLQQGSGAWHLTLQKTLATTITIGDDFFFV